MGSEIRKKPIPDPEVKKDPDTQPCYTILVCVRWTRLGVTSL
jgi:hypothetical protein